MSDEKPNAVEQAKHALHCLYIAVAEDVARDVSVKVLDAIASLEAERSEGRKLLERWVGWLNTESDAIRIVGADGDNLRAVTNAYLERREG